MKLKGLRWWVVGLVALATVINYIDRQSLNVLWPTAFEELFPEMTFDERKAVYGTVSLVFILAYAFGQAIFGKIFDWIGTRMGFVLRRRRTHLRVASFRSASFAACSGWPKPATGRGRPRRMLNGFQPKSGPWRRVSSIPAPRSGGSYPSR